MRITAQIILLVFLLSACNEQQQKEPEKINEQKPDSLMPSAAVSGEIKPEPDSVLIKEITQMIPVSITDSAGKNVYEKYGLDFNSNCYACDAAKISVTEKKITLINVCDAKKTEAFEINSINKVDSTLKIKTSRVEYIFTKIDKAPVYELRINGIIEKTDNLKTSKYYTPAKIIKKFKQHDCGDFQG